jgi:hypothetical protein
MDNRECEKMKEENNISDAHIATYNNFLAPDPASFGVYKLMEQFYPAFAKRLFNNNPFMRKIVMSNLNPMFILEYPICGKCETLAAWSDTIVVNDRKIKTCYCFANGCGNTTRNPVTLREWMIDELKHKAPPDIAEQAYFVVDDIAMSFMRIAKTQLESVLKEHREKIREEMKNG